MIFEFTDKFHETEVDKITKQPIAAFLSSAEFSRYHTLFGIDDSDYKKHTDKNINFRTRIDIRIDYTFGTIRIADPDITQKNDRVLAFFLKKNQIIIIEISDKEHSVRDIFLKAIEKFSDAEYCSAKFISIFLDLLIYDDYSGLELIEYEISRIENKIISESEYKNFNEELLKYKQKLLSLRNYYEQLIDIGQTFIEKENTIFSDNDKVCFSNFIKKSERLCSNVNLIRDSLVQLRETYQSHLDLKLNNTMKIFTVITAFFSPLTLIAGWYGMNFEFMPELHWRYGYFFVILLSISSVICCLVIFKRKKMM